QPEDVRHLRRAGTRDLLEEDRLLDQRRPGPAVLGRPAQSGPAALGQRALPGAAEVEQLAVAVGLTAGMVVRDPLADGVTELALLRGQGQVHRARTVQPRPPRGA